MKEIVFLNQNVDKWEEIDALFTQKKEIDPDHLAHLYIDLTDDLSYARTYYPRSNTLKYLNSLTAKVHHAIYKNRREDRGSFGRFWKYDVPKAVYDNKRHFVVSVLVFVLAMLVGAYSAANDDEYVRLILGDFYVDMTLNNIDQGDPMAVYKGASEQSMFFGITTNNIRVSFIAFVFGIFGAFGTGYVLLFNGVMLGSFQYFFHQHGLLYESAITIWIHGTLEIFAIVMAGAAGMSIGNSFMFPQTYKRLVAFQHGARRGITIIVGLIPVFITAGFLESFVTRHTEWPDGIQIGIIAASALFIGWYFFWYPEKLYNPRYFFPEKETTPLK